MLRFARGLALFISIMLASMLSSQAEVKATYYSMDFGENFPHAFVHLTGTKEDGTEVNQYLGFTAKVISPAILMASVRGKVVRREPKYLDVSEPRFSIIIDEQQFAAIFETAEKWEKRRGRSYNLRKRNCVHFVADTIEAIGLDVNRKSKKWRKPKGFLREAALMNSELVYDYDNPPTDLAVAEPETTNSSE